MEEPGPCEIAADVKVGLAEVLHCLRCCPAGTPTEEHARIPQELARLNLLDFDGIPVRTAMDPVTVMMGKTTSQELSQSQHCGTG
eukprot:CAMPEP_0179149340 /NCGR_PEP_ID=MMETSP0796-20121207/72339_1 /TAXON_ID=73915 /ORGANISM="Pyrodinium bahamense, Strain pbaha01" /LENGTH=84 /DNA_ID=CAMNT_0020850167 /DNA_START=611 /DNA_END=862 /DNA_ORIENTATION=-